MNTSIGINSPQIKEFGGEIDAFEVEIIELGLDRVNILDKEVEGEILSKALYLASSYGTGFTIHAPHSDSRVEEIRTDFSTCSGRNFAVMGKTLRIASEIGAKYIVVHPGNLNESKKCLNLNILNLINLCKLAEDYGITLLLENLFDRNGGNKIGVLPGEILHIIEAVGSEYLKINLDIGHAFIASNAYGFPMDDYFGLGEHVHQMHLHDNFGILESESMFGDLHLPLGHGRINFAEVFKNILRTDARNLILEVKNSTREYTLGSLAQIREFCRLRYPVLAYHTEPVACVH